MISFLIYILSITGLLKWRKRFKYEIFKFSDDNFHCEIFAYQIFIMQLLLIFPQQQYIDIYKNDKFILRLNNHKIIYQLLKFLKNHNLLYYIKQSTINYNSFEITIHRKLKILIHRKQIKII